MFSKLELITIIIAITALLLPSLRNWYNEWKRLEETKKYILNILKEMLDPLRKKIEGLEKLIKSVKNVDSKNFNILQYSTFYVENLNKISHRDLYKIFVQKNICLSFEEKMSHFKELNNPISYLLKYNEIENRNIIQFSKDLRRYEKKFHTNANTILRLNDKYKFNIIKNNKRLAEDVFFAKFNKIIVKWHNNEKHNLISVTKNLLIDPLNLFCIEDSSDDRSMEILPLTINCHYEYSDIENLRDQHQKSLSQSFEELQSKLAKLEQFIKYYN